MANKYQKLSSGTIWSNSNEGDIIQLNNPNGPQFRWIPGLGGAFRSGIIYNDSQVWNEHTNFGFGSASFGQNNLASGRHSFAMGENSEASGQFSVVAGHTTFSKSNFSLGLGQSSQAGIQGGNGDGAVAIGYQAKALHAGSVGIGQEVRIGDETKTFNGGAHSFGLGINLDIKDFHTIASGSDIHTFNDDNEVRSFHSLLLGTEINSNAHSVAAFGEKISIAKHARQNFSSGAAITIGEGSSNTFAHGENVKIGVPVDDLFFQFAGPYSTPNSHFTIAFGSRVQVGVNASFNAVLPSDHTTIEDGSVFNLAQGGGINIKDTYYSRAHGETLKLENTHFSSVIGHNNEVIDSNFSHVFGLHNKSNNSFGSVLFGNQNNTVNGWYNLGQGIHNKFLDSGWSFGFGISNTIQNSNHSSISGTNNKIEASRYAHAHGNEIELTNVIGANAYGWGHDIENSNYSSANGSGNLIKNSVASFAAGDKNKIDNSSYGNGNYGWNTAVGGSNEILSTSLKPSFANFVAGTGNKIIGANSSTVLGQYSQVKGDFSFASGYLAKANGFSSLAVGSHTAVNGNNSTAIGSLLNIGVEGTNTQFALAIGFNSTVEKFAGAVIGNNLHSKASNAFVIGSSDSPLENSDQNSLMVGFSDKSTLKVQDLTYTNASSQVVNKRGVQVNGVLELTEVNSDIFDNPLDLDVPGTEPFKGILYHNADKLIWKTAQGSVTLVEGSTMTSPWTLNGLDVSRDAGKVGIGTSTPAATLHATGSVKLDLDNSPTPQTGQVLTYDASGNAAWTTVNSTLDTGDDINGAQTNGVLYADASGKLQNVDSFQYDAASNKLFLGGIAPILEINQSGRIDLGQAVLTESSDALKITSPGTTSLKLVSGGFDQAQFTDTVNWFKQKVGIGTTLNTADEALHVVGKVKIENADAQDGYVLTSDANGVATWEALPNGDGNIASGDLTFEASRTHTIGNNNLTFKGGNLNVGTQAEKTNLTVDGDLVIKGNEAAGRVLISDNNGKATWTDFNPADGNLATTDLVQAYEPRTYDLNGQNLLFAGNGNLIVDTNTTLKITSGTPGTDKVLTSDANGVATWKTINTIPSVDPKSMTYLDLVNKGTVSGTLAGLKKVNSVYAPPTTSPWTPVGVGSGENDPYVVHKDAEITSIRVNVTNIAVGTGTVGSNVVLRMQVFNLFYSTRALLATYDIPVSDLTKVGIWNDVGSAQNMQSLILEGDGMKVINNNSVMEKAKVLAGDMIGVQFTNISGNNNGINAIASCYASLELTNL